MSPKGTFQGAILIALILFVLVSGRAQTKNPPRSDYTQVSIELEKLIQHEVTEKQLPGFSIVLVDDQQIVWAQGFGFADPARKLPATAETVYRVGSVSRLFTDIGIMQLVERGELDLDAPITKYAPDFNPQNPFGAPITLRELMTHRAGLVQWMEYVPLKKISEDVWEFPEDSSYDHEELTFLRDKSGCATRVKVGEVLFPRRPACTQLK